MQTIQISPQIETQPFEKLVRFIPIFWYSHEIFPLDILIIPMKYPYRYPVNTVRTLALCLT